MISAGCGYAWTGIVSKLVTDEVAAGAIAVALAWLATLAASEFVALLSEMSALQRRPATHVAPPMFAVQVLIPVLVAPFLFGESWADTPLGGVGARSPRSRSRSPAPSWSPARAAVGGVIESAQRERSRPRAEWARSRAPLLAFGRADPALRACAAGCPARSSR